MVDVQLYSSGSSSDCHATAKAINAHPDYNGGPKVSCVSKRGVWKCVYVNWLAVGRVTAKLVLFFVSNKNLSPSRCADVGTEFAC